ncbi:MAG TPA: hypothetical protein VM689_17230 [Aliidongia sp.]|nr:hypothetical protein [Aliidongia sp.]
MPAPLFAVQYLTAAGLADFAAGNTPILGVVGYGATRPAGLPDACPFAEAPVVPVTGEAMFEVWNTRAPVETKGVGAVRGSYNGEVTFGLVELEEGTDRTFETVVEHAYRGLFDFLDAVPCGTPVRFWNYLPHITEEEDGMERYRRFNVGRHDAFSDRLTLPVPPVASALGGKVGKPLIYFLAAREPARTIENPRQVSAYAYPPIYGPRSPRFSRAATHGNGGAPSLLISGTASIVGHESLHRGDLAAQLGETLENIRLLIGEGERQGLPPGRTGWALKAYLRHAEDYEAVHPAVERMFGADCQCLYLSADICRPELLVEIEAFRMTGAA